MSQRRRTIGQDKRGSWPRGGQGTGSTPARASTQPDKVVKPEGCSKVAAHAAKREGYKEPLASEWQRDEAHFHRTCVLAGGQQC